MAYYVKKNGQLEKIAGNVSISHADWNETDDRKFTKIKNRPDTLNTLDEIMSNENEHSLAGANAVKELTNSVATIANELMETSAKVDILRNSDLGINVVETGESIHIDDSSDNRIPELRLYGKCFQNKTTGKNLLDYSGGSAVKNDVEYTYNADGTVTANGTASANSSYYKSITLKAGQYILSGSPSGGSSNTYYISTNIGVGNDYGNGVTFTVDSETTLNIYCNVRSGYNAKNITFKPMIRLASIEDSTYEPYTGGISSPNPQYPQDIVVSGESYNLLYKKATSQTLNGVTFTVNEDGSVTANGKSNGNSTLVITNVFVGTGNKVILSGCPSGGGDSKYAIALAEVGTTTRVASDYGNEVEYVANKDYYDIRIIVWSGLTANNLTFKPMIRKASVKNDRYMPYGKGSVEVTSYGKNLLPYHYINGTRTQSGITFTVNTDGSVVANGTAESNIAFTLYGRTNTNGLPVKKGTYVYSGCPSGGSMSTYRLGANITVNGAAKEVGIETGNGVKFTLDGDDYDEENVYLGIYVMVYSGATLDNVLFRPMLIFSSDTDDTYEPYKSITSTIQTPNGLAGIPVSSGGNYTDENGQQLICDEIVKYADGSGEYIKRVKSVVFDGSEDESWSMSGSADIKRFSINVSDAKVLDYRTSLLCSHGAFSNGYDDGAAFISGGSFYLYKEGITNASNFKTWLNSNNVNICYELSSPITTPLTEEQLSELLKLKTFYPITNISNDFDCGMKVKYIADSKAYVDKNLALQAQAQEESMLSMFMLLPDAVQAAMIEKDTNNLLMESEE